MADKKFEAILTLLVPQVVQLICENYPMVRPETFMNPRYILCWSRRTPNCGILARLLCLICMMKKKRQETLRYRRRYEYEQARRLPHLLRGNL